MLGFEKLMVEVSFKDLLKKIYHVEDFELDGLKVNVELLPKNRINLLELVPQELIFPQSQVQTKVQAPAIKTKGPSTPIEQPMSLPDVIIDKIDLHKARCVLLIKRSAPFFQPY